MNTKLKNGQSRYKSKAKDITKKKYQLLTLVKTTDRLNDAAFEKHGDAYLEFPAIIQKNNNNYEIKLTKCKVA